MRVYCLVGCCCCLITRYFPLPWQVDGELEALMENGEGLSDKNQVLSLSRLMVRIETLEQKLTCLKLIQVNTLILIYFLFLSLRWDI